MRKMSRMSRPRRCSISTSLSTKGWPNRSAMMCPTVVLPAPMKPTSTTTIGFSFAYCGNEGDATVGCWPFQHAGVRNMTELYPPIEPYDQGLLDVGDGNLVYWETCGNPDGKPAVMVHGGPGQGCVPNMRRMFRSEERRVGKECRSRWGRYQ